MEEMKMTYDDDTRQKDEDAILAARGALPNTNNFEVLPVGNSDLFGGDQLQVGQDGRAYLASPATDYSGIPTLGGPTGREPRQPVERQPEPALEQVPPSPRRPTVPNPKTPEQLAREADEMLNRMRAEHQSSMSAAPAVDPNKPRGMF